MEQLENDVELDLDNDDKTLSSIKRYVQMKRVFDLIVSLLMFIVLLPISIIIGLWIALDSGLPILFKQERMGYKGRTFKIIKFRTMKNDSFTKDGITHKGDMRITRIGKILRKFRLDEIPQLINVIKGEMSFVGPRPDMPHLYRNTNKLYKYVLLVPPGITGKATLEFKDEDELINNSDNPEKFYNEIIFPEKVRLNVEYIKEATILKDMKIMIETVVRVIK
ncbi:sugar transferase [Gracilibacillus kekensis]|uniref:Sugar transferase involved in LPS biosynthesis (Colanic, teichoic acid) n=1 Tax=Gracilibacillus kekensis TaxID=1027249 RepID=A0A1M7K356_9BACI|nr:sugar transferase [Gracilibacillus kekensis]SHM59624.1 Sugar transferase involved in LPS biosynthesis (colanic, teichoic acid) [Gracilibacillus kekensis]